MFAQNESKTHVVLLILIPYSQLIFWTRNQMDRNCYTLLLWPEHNKQFFGMAAEESTSLQPWGLPATPSWHGPWFAQLSATIWKICFIIKYKSKGLGRSLKMLEATGPFSSSRNCINAKSCSVFWRDHLRNSCMALLIACCRWIFLENHCIFIPECSSILETLRFSPFVTCCVSKNKRNHCDWLWLTVSICDSFFQWVFLKRFLSIRVSSELWDALGLDRSAKGIMWCCT